MAIGKARRRAVDSPMISSRTGCELTVVLVLTILTIFFFPSVQGPYSVVHGPATAFRAARPAAIAHASIVHGAMHSIRNSSGFDAAGCGSVDPLENGIASEAIPECSATLRC